MVNGITTKSYMPMITLIGTDNIKEAERDSHGIRYRGSQPES